MPTSAWCPIENSTEGTVNHTLDMFLNSPLKICGEIELRIRQHLMGRMKGLQKIVRVCSHPQSLAQCRQWLDEHLPNIERVPVSSNAEAARRARDEDGTAAIAGEAAAEVYNLGVIVPEIEDTADNTTRFLVIGRKLFSASGQDKTTLAGVGRRRTVARRAASVAGAAGGQRHHHDPHRVPAVAQAQMGLCVLHRRGRPCRAAAAVHRAGRAEKGVHPVSGAGVVPGGGAVSPGMRVCCAA